jgi:hypothetical protein
LAGRKNPHPAYVSPPGRLLRNAMTAHLRRQYQPPCQQRLFADLGAGEIDLIVVYYYNVSFVSVG